MWVQRPAPDDALEARGFGRLRPADLGSSTWDVFAADGRPAGAVELPERFTPTASDGRSIYGYGLDAADVLYVARLEISQR